MSEQKTTETTTPTPFKDRFSQDQWKQIKEKIYLLSSHNETETIPDIIKILDFLRELNASKDYDEFFGDKAIKNWFFNEFFATTAKNFINTRVFNGKEVLQMVNQILEEFVLFWMKSLNEDNLKLAEMAKVILDPTRAYYKANDQEEITSSNLSTLMREPTPEHLQWINALKEGDLIDALKIEQTHKKICWSRAKIAHVLDNHLKITFLNDKESFNRYLDRVTNANEIMPPGTKTQDYDWRMNIKAGDIIDVCDTSNVWYNSTILEASTLVLEEGIEIKQIFVGYRIYDENGDKVDAEGKKFVGWSSRYDEWLSVTNPRVQPRNKMAKKLYMASSSQVDDPQIEDSNDHIYAVNENINARIYCITRQGYCRSVFLVGLLNKIGHMGVFDNILGRISDKAKWCPIDVTSGLVSILGNCYSVFQRDFALDFIPKLKNAVWENILKSPDGNIRNFSKEKIEAITTGFDSLLKRVYSIPEKQEMIETLSLEVSVICFETDFLERKLQGIKSIVEIIKQIKYGNMKFLTTTHLNDVIKKYEVFDKIYGKRGHVSMIQRSAEFLKHMINENAVEPDQLELVWSATLKGDKEAKLAVYKVLSEIALHFKAEHLDFVILKISEIEPNEIISEEIELVYELSRYTLRPVAFIKKSCDFYWNIITENRAYSSAISEQALTRFCDIMKGWELREQRFSVLLDCIANIEKGTSVLSSIKIMKKLIDNYPSSPSATEQYTKATCLDHLVAEKGLLKILVQNLTEFKGSMKARLTGRDKYTEEELDKLTGDNYTYVNHIAERLSFIHFVLSSSSSEVNLTLEFLKNIWDTVVNNALIKSERDVLYKWLKESTESKATFPMSIDDLIKFFKEKMTDDRESKDITTEGFKCFKNIFLLINEKLQKVSKNSTSSSVNSYPSTTYTVGGTTYMSYSYSYDDNKSKENDFGYQILVFPSDLEGIQSIWEVILQTESEEVIETAIEFLNKLYTSPGGDLEKKTTELSHEYLANCMKKLNSILTQRNAYSEQALTNGSLRCLQLIKSLMDESERKGVGNLKSHSGLVKGEQLSFTVTNDLTAGSDIPKKLEMRVYSNITVHELRAEIAKQIKASWDQVKLQRYLAQKEIKDNENGKTLGDIRIKNGETITALKRPTPPIPQANLLMGDGSMNPLAKKIFVEWFERFSENGKMSPDNCAAFINSCTNDGCKGDDKRVKDVFVVNDTDRDGFLTMDNFLEFYYGACKQRPHVVWSNLGSHYYRNDLRKPTEIEEEKIDVKNLPRYLLSTHQEHFKLLFSLLDYGGKIAIEAWKLINRLPTSPEIFKEIILLEGVRGKQSPNWEQILDSNSIYKLLYSLHIMEFLMEDEDEKDTEEESLIEFISKDDPKLQEFKKSWRSDFIENGGFEHLFKIFNSYTKKDTISLTIFDKNVLSFILKILKNYLTATFAKKVSGLYRNLSFIRLFHLSLDFIQDYLRTEGKPLEPVNEEAPKELEKKSSSVQETVAPIQRAVSKDDATKKKELEEKKKENLKIEETADFRVLVEKLSGDLGHHILSTINFKDMVKLCVTQGLELLNKATELESEDRLILEYSISILTAILLYDNSLLEYLFNPDNSSSNLANGKDYLLEGIFCTKSLNTRKNFAHAFYIISKQTAGYKDGFMSKYIIKLFLQNLPNPQIDNRKDCNQYFELLCKLIEETYQGKTSQEEEDKSLNFDFLIESTIHQLKEHNSIEKRSGASGNDKILMGLLNLLEKIILVKPHLRDLVGDPKKHNFVHEIFATCLFDIADRETNFPHYSEGVDASNFSKDYVKCKSRDSRVIAYKLLGTLCRGHERNFNQLLGDLATLTTKIPIANNWTYHPAADSKSFWGYVGIKNLGCICYMNSMLQQFYMTPTFRYAVMMADDKKEPNLVNKDNKYMIDDNVLHQLQKMFGFLELSDRQDYNPHEFCFSFKDFQGNPVNVSIQQDAQEFLNMIFDKLEMGLKNTPFRHILDSVYGGKTCQQLICSNCKFVKSREDTFYNMSLEVKNMKTIHDSMEKYIAGEVIDDYFCDNCKKKVSTTKRSCISQPPNVMIVHLQRIIFDWEAMVNMKVNSRLEFPHELNIEPYTQDGLEWREKQKEKDRKAKGASEESPKKVGATGEEEDQQKEKEEETVIQTEKDKKEESSPGNEEPLGPYMKHPKDYYEYRLAGIVVHIGTADFGHYYSYINTNRGDPSKKKDTPNKWLEYNDSTIRDFDVKNIESECFGGASTESSDDSWGWGKAGRDNSKNAYILVYERVVKDPVKMTVHEETESKFLDTYLDLKNPDNANKHKIYDVKPNPEDKDGKAHQIYEVDYYSVKKFVPATAYKKVWEDNHKFMFERHLYNEDFFKFIKEVCSAIKMPELTNENVANFIYQGYKEISEDSKQGYLSIIKILGNLIYSLLAKARDNNQIVEICTTMKQLMVIVPEAAHEFFEKIVLKDIKYTIELMSTCPDRAVRLNVGQIILHAINVMISYGGFDLQLKKFEGKEEEIEKATEKGPLQIEYTIVKFLNMLYGIMPVEIAKNWTKLGPYLEFWRDFAFAGTPQVRYLYQKQMIAYLIDFFLEKKSPLGNEFSEHKHSMGNRYANPEFDPLVQTIAILLRRSKVVTKSGRLPNTVLTQFEQFELNPNDMKCLDSVEFFDRALNEKYDPNAFGILVEHLSFENDQFSYQLAILILRGLNKSNFEEARPFLEAMTYFLNISDYLQLKRIEWVLGFPQPIVQPILNGLPSYGMFGNNLIDESVYNYESNLPLEHGNTSVLNLILQNRKRLENLCLVCLRQVLTLCNLNPTIFEYFVNLPPPSYNLAKFSDWIKSFIENYISDAKRYYYGGYPKEEAGNEALKLFNAFEEKLNKKMQLNQTFIATMQQNSKKDTDSVVKVEEEKKQEATEHHIPENKEEAKQASDPVNVLKSLNPAYIIGETVKEEQIREIQLLDAEPGVCFSETQVTTYITESFPIGNSNIAFPTALVRESHLNSHLVKPESSLAHFIQPRTVTVNVPGSASKQTRAAVPDNSTHIEFNLKGSELLPIGFDVEAPGPIKASGTQTDDEVGKVHSTPEAGEKSDAGAPGEERTENEAKQSSGPSAAGNQTQEESKDQGKPEVSTSTEVALKEEPIELIDVAIKYEVNPVIRRFFVTNNTNDSYHVTLALAPKSANFLNFRIPSAVIQTAVKPHQSACLLTIAKIFPEMEWGDYDQNCVIQKMQSN